MRVLIVEDEQKMAKLLKKGLEEETHSVMLAQEGVEGFEISQTYPFDVIILDVMLRHSGRMLTRNAMINANWAFDSQIENNTLDAFVRLLRKKVDSEHALKLIHTIRGFGYVLREGEP